MSGILFLENCRLVIIRTLLNVFFFKDFCFVLTNNLYLLIFCSFTMPLEVEDEFLRNWSEFCKFAQDEIKPTRGQDNSLAEENSLFLKLMQDHKSELYEECGFGVKLSDKLDELIQKAEEYCLPNIVNLFEKFKLRAQVKSMSSCTVSLKRIDCFQQRPDKSVKGKRKALQKCSNSRFEDSSAADTDMEQELPSPDSQELGRGKRKKIAKIKFEFSEESPFSYKAKESPQSISSKAKSVSRSEPGSKKIDSKANEPITKAPRRGGIKAKGKKDDANTEPRSSISLNGQLNSTKTSNHKTDKDVGQIVQPQSTAESSSVKGGEVVGLCMSVDAETELTNGQGMPVDTETEHNNGQGVSVDAQMVNSGQGTDCDIAPSIFDVKIEGDKEPELAENCPKEDQPIDVNEGDSLKRAEEEGIASDIAFKEEDCSEEKKSKKTRGPQKAPKKLPYHKVPYICSMCKTRFAAYSTLRRHWARAHTPDKKFNFANPPKLLFCAVCEEKFSMPHQFLKHYRAHSARSCSDHRHSHPESQTIEGDKGQSPGENGTLVSKGTTAEDNSKQSTLAEDDKENGQLVKGEDGSNQEGLIDFESAKENKKDEMENGIKRKTEVIKRKKGRGPQKRPKKFPWSLVPIVCAMCKTRYSTYSTLRRHWTKMHSDKKQFDRQNPPNLMLCTVCDETFNWPRQYLKHFREHAAKQEISMDRFKPVKFIGERTDFPCDKLAPITCSVCRKIQHGEGVIYGHWKKEHRSADQPKPPPLFFCDICEQTFDAPRKFKLHYRIHTGAKPHQCEECPKTFRTFSDLTAHMLCHNQSKEFKCTICNKAFIAQKILNRHMKGHLFPCVCDVCGKSYPSKYSLNLHKKIHTGEKPHKCEFCGVAFIQAGSLKLHRRLHLGDKPHVCETCGMRFNSLSHLRTHRRVHTGEKPYKCDKCNYAAASSSRLKDHATVHKDEKPHVCKVPGCGRRYKRLSHLIFHHSKHAGIKPYVCKICGAAFKLSSALSLHKRQDACAFKQEAKSEWSEDAPKENITNYNLLVTTADDTVAMDKVEEPKEEHQTVYIYHDVKDDLQAIDDGTQQIIGINGASQAELAVEDQEGFEQQIVIQIVREPGQEDEDIVLSKEELERIVHLSQQMS